MTSKKQRNKTGEMDYSEQYDFEDITRIVSALEYVRDESQKTGNEDLILIINSAFNLCFCAYYMVLRHENTSNVLKDLSSEGRLKRPSSG